MLHTKPRKRKEIELDSRVLTVDIRRCPESSVLLCTSTDIPGLNLETNTYDEMKREIRLIVPELAQHNLNLSADDMANVVILVRSNRSSPTTQAAKVYFEDWQIGSTAAPLTL